jgi:hypothetical protein
LVSLTNKAPLVKTPTESNLIFSLLLLHAPCYELPAFLTI